MKPMTRKDFKLEWFSGTKGGQHVNKHANCCRITHYESGISAQCTRHRDRPSNQRDAFKVLVSRLLEHYGEAEVRTKADDGRVRTYHAERNEVLDHASGLRMSYREVVDKANLGPMIEARALAYPSSCPS